ncbi:DNA polymerase I A, chloroplastic isoform X2 [Elaeis guineensis]|uniref:DNA polymerase I A, chloroplastic isoform X2 n=1 Tax=Elaeis guineensis var. tenera TaxID=51953 RepID=A0A6I9QAW5_ELAGV|nr:DNA polymerase I A, chloroplastic isoform X2 [Elaeis guineensis]
MAMGLSTYGSPLRPCSPSPTSWFSSSLRRSVTGLTRLPLQPVSGVVGHEYHSLPESDAHRGPKNFSSDFGLSSNREVMGRTYSAAHASHDVYSKSKSTWNRERCKIMRDKLCQGIAIGRVLPSSQELVDLHDETASNSVNGFEKAIFPNYSSIRDSMLPCSGMGNSITSSFKENPLMDTTWHSESLMTQAVEEGIQPNGSQLLKHMNDVKEPLSGLAGLRSNNVSEADKATCQSTEHCIETSLDQRSHPKKLIGPKGENQQKLAQIYDKVVVVDNISRAKKVVQMLMTKYRNFIHACDTEVSKIDVKQETPVGHGEIICFSIYSGPEADFGNGKSCIWVDVLDGGRSVLMEFAPFFEDPCIKKVWHNYSFDSHVIENYGIKLSGFHVDTMHLARLWDSSRRADGGYSLESLTGDSRVMSTKQSCRDKELVVGKISMKSIFGKKKLKKDGSEGKLITVAPVEILQREERVPWICYSALDSISTWKLYDSLKEKLEKMDWTLDGVKRGSMYDFYEEYWRPFGVLLVKMESEGMLVDRAYLSEIQKVAIAEQEVAADKFRKWASKYCPDAKYMNVGSDAQIRQLFFGGTQNRKDQNETLPSSKTFKVPNTENVIEEGKKSPSKYRTIELQSLGVQMPTEMYTPSGWPSVSGDALKIFAGKVSTDEIYLTNEYETKSDGTSSDGKGTSFYGTAYEAFNGGKEGKEACHAIAALCEVCSIDSLISNFILPLQGSHISCKNGRVHCSLNINTETGRLSARRPNLQNQPALEKDRYKIRQAFVAEPGHTLIVADYGQLELRILAHLANCKSMLDAFKAGGDFHSRTAMNMYAHVREAVEEKRVLLEWHPQPGEEKPPVPLLKVSTNEAKKTVELWYNDRKEVLRWQQKCKKKAQEEGCVYTLLGRRRCFPSMTHASHGQKGHIERAAINTPVQGSAADVAMCAMLEIDRNTRLKELGWRLLLQVHDEVILEGPTESAELAKAIVIECMSKPFYGTNFLKVGLSVDAKCAQNWYAAK